MTILSLDLEMNQPSGKIIQIGFTIGDVDSREILISKYINVDPHETLNPRIIELTGITQDDVDSGIELDRAYDEVYYWHKLYQCFMNPVTWGGGDSWELKKQLMGIEETGIMSSIENGEERLYKLVRDKLPENEWCFGRRWIDAKTVYVTSRIANSRPIKSGLKKSCGQMGIQFQGPAHNAERDAYNTLMIYFKFLDLMKVAQL